jgi:transposase
MAASRSLPHALVRRAQMVLWTESGITDQEVARRLKVSAPTVNFWRTRFGERRAAGLHDELKPGRPRTHSDERLARLLKTALAEQPKAGTHWSMRGLERRTGISKSAVQRYLNLLNLSDILCVRHNMVTKGSRYAETEEERAGNAGVGDQTGVA